MGAHYDRVILLYERRRYELAEEELRRELAERPADAMSHAMIGLCRDCARRPGALAWALKAVELAPDEPFVHFALSLVQDGVSPRDAHMALDEAIRLDPRNSAYFFLKASREFWRSRYRASLAAADHGLYAQADHSGCASFRALALMKLGRHAEAERAIAWALDLDPEDDFVHAAEGWKQSELGHKAKARGHYREALRINPSNQWAEFGLSALRAEDERPAPTWHAMAFVMIFPACSFAILIGQSEYQRQHDAGQSPPFDGLVLALGAGAWPKSLPAVLLLISYLPLLILCLYRKVRAIRRP